MNRDQLYNLTSLRFFAAFAIYLHHLGVVGITPSKYLGNLNLGLAVSFFFVLSGFILSYSYDGRINSARDAARLVGVRFFRLWPVHMACGLFVIVAFGFPGGFLNTYLFVTLQHTWVPTYASGFFLNEVSWSISVEMYFYIVFPFIIMMRARNIVITYITWSAVVVAFMATLTLWPQLFSFSKFAPDVSVLDYNGVTADSLLYMFPPIRFVEFLCGMVVYQVFKRVKIPDRAIGAAQLAVILQVLIYATQYQPLTESTYWLFGPIFGFSFAHYGGFPIFALAIYAFAHQNGAISSALSCRVLVRLGEISFSFYMIHRLILRAIATSSLPVYLPPTGLAVLGFVMATAASMILYSLVEAPALKVAKRYILGRKSESREMLPTALRTIPTQREYL